MTHPTAYLLAPLLAAAVVAGAQAQTPAAASAQKPAATLAQSAGGPAEQPNTQVTSDTMQYDDSKHESVFTGKVIATRGQLNIYADKLKVSEDKDGYQYGVATADKGKVVTITEDRPDTYEHIEGTGLRGEYDGKKQQFDLIGHAVVIRYICGKPFDTIRGERVRYYQKSDVYEAQGGPNSAGPDGRVRSLAEPRSKAQAAMQACAAQHGKPAVKKPEPAAKK